MPSVCAKLAIRMGNSRYHWKRYPCSPELRKEKCKNKNEEDWTEYRLGYVAQVIILENMFATKLEIGEKNI